MGRFWFSALASLCAAGCAVQSPAPPTPGPDVVADAGAVDPAKIRRLRPAFPSGYEVAALSSPTPPASAWGLGPGWSADPPQCAVLADPVAGATGQGLSGSGPGGIVYVAAAESASPGGPDPGLINDCSRWSMTSGRTVALVERAEIRPIEGALAVAMLATARTVVEGGTETSADARTAVAYVGAHVVVVTVVTDPGSPSPQLPSDFAETFLREAVTTLRS